MSDRIPEIETNVNLLRSIIWQYDNAELVKSLISQKNEWYKKEQAEFWDNWYRDVFDIRTASDFGLEIWAIILGVSFLVPDCPGKVLTTEQKRLICRLRYYQLITRCTIPEVNEITMKLFATENGKAYALDPNDMSCIMYVFTEQPTSDLALILAKYDLLPRPATVGLNYRVVRYTPFGFGEHYQNFENGAFWDGGSLINYAWRINLSFDNSTGLLSGVISSSDSTIALSDIDVTLFYTNVATGQAFTRDVVTTAGGKFTDTVPDSVRYRVVAKAQIFTPICTTDDVESRPLEFIYIIPGARFVMRIDNVSRPIFYARMDEQFTVDYGDGVDSKDYSFIRDENSPGKTYGWVISTRALSVGADYTITVKRSDTIRFCSHATLTSGIIFNTLRELITVSGGRTDITYLAMNCTGLYLLHDGVFDYLPNAANFTYSFKGCSRLLALPTGLFDKCINANSFLETFRQCTALMLLPDSLFEGLSSVNSFHQTFFDCASLKTVGNRVFKGCSTNTDFSNIFMGCSSLTTVGADIFSGCFNVTSFAKAFANCSALVNMPLFSDCNKVTAFTACFNNCSSLEKITPYAFDGKTLCSTFQSIFSGCSALIIVPNGVFRGCSAATSFAYAFQYCYGLTSLSGDIFEDCTKTNDVQYMFDNCTSLTSLPATLLNWFSALQSSTTRMFGYCTALTGIPAGFFDKCENLTALASSFLSCKNLTALPPAMFKYNIKLITVSAMFSGCDIRTVPVDTFATCPLIIYIDMLFMDNVNFHDIPENLFTNNPDVISFASAFSHTNITSVPSGLFRNNVKATDFNGTFSHCLNLKNVGDGLLNTTSARVISYLFQYCSLLENNLNAIFNLSNYPTIINANSAFYDCVHIEGKGLDFISAVPGVTAATSKRNTFINNTSLTDYDQIPAAWGGGGA